MRLGELTNIRVEEALNMDQPGLIVESENGIIDGSIEAQFKNLEKLFESVGIFEDE